MPKPPPIERFRVSCEVEHTQLGSIVAMFTKMGLVGIGYELITDVRTYRSNSKPPPGQSARDLLIPWLEEHPTFKAIEAAKFLEANGSTKAAAYPVLSSLVEDKTLRKLGPGNYQRSDVRAIAPPKKHMKKKAPAKPKRVVHEVSHGEAILRLARRNHGRVTMDNIRANFSKQKRNIASIHPTLHDLIATEKLEKAGESTYALLRKPNGAAPTEVTTNG